MSLEHAILGFLGYKALSGYDLKKMFDATVQHFWRADQSQIYRTLARLAQHGFAKVEVKQQSERPDRRVFHITPDGRAELRRWLRAPLPAPQPHDATLVKVFFSGQLPDEELIAMLEGGAAEMRERLRLYEQLPAQLRAYRSVVRSARERACWGLTLDAGISATRAKLAWSGRTIARLKRQRRRGCPSAVRTRRKS
jgi:PadR family transcriptional regulator, regulatory protein AphA